eukprot:gene6004-10002_t
MTEDIKKYVRENEVEELFKSLLEAVLLEQPKNVSEFLIKQIEQNHKPTEEKIYRKSIDEFTFGAKSKEEILNEEEEDEEKNTTIIDTNLSENLRRRYSTSTIRRRAFSAESINLQDLDDFVPPYNQKTEDEIQVLNNAFSNNPLFATVDKEDLDVLYGAMFSLKFKKGDYIIKQNEKGENLFVIEKGTCEIYVSKEGCEQDQLVKTCFPGDYFGELALMYGTPRAASVKCITDTVVWAIDRLTFRKIIMGRTMEKRRIYSDFLRNIKILETMNDYERQTLADALQPKSFSEGDQIVKQGEDGYSFFIITSGEANVWKYLDGKKVDLMTLKKGDYFGELALLFNEPRAATVQATTSLKTVSLNAKSFKSLLGPLDDILKRNTEMYDYYMNEKNKK